MGTPHANLFGSNLARTPRGTPANRSPSAIPTRCANFRVKASRLPRYADEAGYRRDKDKQRLASAFGPGPGVVKVPLRAVLAVVSAGAEPARWRGGRRMQARD